MVFMVFVGSFLTSINRAEAVGVDTVVKLVGGKAIVRALAEKAGMALSKKQVTNVAGYIEKKTFDGDLKAIDFVKNANSAVGSASEKSGFKKYLLDPALWLTGLDLVLLAVGAFQNGYDKSEPVPIIGDDGCIAPVTVGLLSNWVVLRGTQSGTSGNQTYLITWDGGWSDFSGTTFRLGDTLNLKFKTAIQSSGGAWSTLSFSNLDASGYISYFLQNNDPANFMSSNKDIMSPGQTVIGFTSACGKSVTNYTVNNTDIVNISNVDNSVKQAFDNDTYNTNITYVMGVDIPDTVNFDDSTPWNDVDPGLPDIIKVPPVDTDNDGIPDDTDITPGGETPIPDDTGIFAKLFPVLLIVKLFGVLGSCLMYLIRMFQFIMTIPGIDAIPIDNDAFVWFRSAQIVGIKIYDVVSSLAGVGLSFIVFRAIRRAYL
jgi:hypothetical protein